MAPEGIIQQKLEKSPKENIVIVYVLSGHGMIHDGRQVLLLNEFDKESKFYKFWPVEQHIRHIAKRHKNSYQIAFNSSCRQVFNKELGDCFDKNDKSHGRNLNESEQKDQAEEDEELLQKKDSSEHD